MDISVIIPLYKAREYIEACLKSLLEQTIIDQMEIIVVDDCGKDGSVDVLQIIQKQHTKGSCIRLVQMEHNQGAWAARNRGIECANGRYIGFCDADDWVDKQMYERLLAEAEVYNADFAVCNVMKVYENNGKSVTLNHPIRHSAVMDDELKKKFFVEGKALFSTAIYSKKLLDDNNIRFPNAKFSEDSCFWWMVVMHTRRIAVVDQVGYYYRIQQSSVSRRPDPDKAFIKLRVHNELMQLFSHQNLYKPFKDELDYMYIKKALLIPLITEAINSNKPRIGELLTRSEVKDIVSNKYFKTDRKKQLLYFMFQKCPTLLSLALKLRYKHDPF